MNIMNLVADFKISQEINEEFITLIIEHKGKEYKLDMRPKDEKFLSRCLEDNYMELIILICSVCKERGRDLVNEEIITESFRRFKYISTTKSNYKILGTILLTSSVNLGVSFVLNNDFLNIYTFILCFILLATGSFLFNKGP